MANPGAQIALLPTPQAGISIADAHAIKVSEYPPWVRSWLTGANATGIGIDDRTSYR